MWLTVFVSSFILDTIAHIGITGGYVSQQLAGVLKPMSQVNFLPLLLEYIIITTGIVYFLTQTNANSKPLSYSAKLGGYYWLNGLWNLRTD